MPRCSDRCCRTCIVQPTGPDAHYCQQWCQANLMVQLGLLVRVLRALMPGSSSSRGQSRWAFIPSRGGARCKEAASCDGGLNQP